MTLRVGPPAPPTDASRTVELRAGLATTTGHRRRVNEDAALCGPAWFVVADGLGGHRGGDVASSIAVDTFAASPAVTGDDPELSVAGVVERVHDRIVAQAAADGPAGMGTTLVGATSTERSVVVFHLGDARCYRLADGELTLLTRDHSHVRELLDAGHIDANDLEGHPLRNVVTRAAGIELGDGPDLAPIGGGSCRLLLCSDGLSGELVPRTIGRVLAGIPDPQAAAERLIELVLAGPARDNATALVVDVTTVAATSTGDVDDGRRGG